MKRRLPLFLVILAVAAAAVYYLLIREPNTIVLTGIVTTDDVRVSSMIQGRLEKLLVKPGDMVKDGQVLAQIQPQEWKADMAFYENSEQQTAAQVDQAKAELKYQEALTRDQIRQAEANLATVQAQSAQAEADLENAKLSFDRESNLHKQSVNSVQAFDQARTAYESAKAHADSLHKQIQSADAALALAKANADQVTARQAALEATSHQLEAASAQKDKAAVRLGYTEIHAPVSGIIDVRAALEGEVVNAGQTIVTLIDPNDLWIRADVEESYIDRIHIGDKLTVRLPSGATREGTVFFRGVDAEYATQRDVSRTKRDIKTFEIRLRCANSDRSLALGMTAYVTLHLK